jgi:dihydroflavonol-4-reductase
MKTLVTGAAGFLGSNLVPVLMQRGHTVRAFVHPADDPSWLGACGAEVMRGDILDPGSVRSALDGCGAVVHAAAITSLWPSRNPGQRRVNIQGTRNVVDAAIFCRVGRMVHIGSANSFGFGERDAPGDETRPYAGGGYGLDYFDSKQAAQQIVLDAARRGDLAAVVANPTYMLGGRDTPWGSSSILLYVYHRRLLRTGGRNFVWVRDVAEGVASALERGRVGECYIMGNTNLSYTRLFDRIARIVGRRVPPIYVPALVARKAGEVLSRYGFLRGGIRLDRTFARIACSRHFYSPRKAVRELGLPQTQIETAIVDAFRWFRGRGYLRVGPPRLWR